MASDTMLPLPDALEELAMVLRSPEFLEDPAGLLREWAAVVAGEVDTTERLYLCEDEGDNPPLAPVESLALALAARGGEVANADLRKRLPDLSAETIRLRLRAMVAQGLLERVGRNSGTRYRMPERGLP